MEIMKNNSFLNLSEHELMQHWHLSFMTFLKKPLRAVQLLSQTPMNVNAIWSQPGQSWGGIVFRRLIQFVTSILEASSALICVNEG